MGGWGEILEEIKASAAANGGKPQFDEVRAAQIDRLHSHTGRAVIVYASGWMHHPQEVLNTTVTGADVHGLMEACHNVPDRELDLILHSPGGDPNAAEQMLRYLRTQFDHIRAIVPLAAKSAGTMLALGCDEIVLGKHSELGPIDPQLTYSTPEGRRTGPAHAMLRDFDRAKKEIAADLTALPTWNPVLRGYAGGMLEICRQQIELSQDIVAAALGQYMLNAITDDDQRNTTAREIAEWFGSDKSYDRFRTHSRPIRIEDLDDLRAKGLIVTPLEDDDDLQDAALSVYHAVDFTLQGPAVKIIENHLRRRYVKRVQAPQQVMIQPAQLQQVIQQQQQAPAAPATPTMNREQRRRAERGK